MRALLPHSLFALLVLLLNGCSPGWFPKDVDRNEVISALGNSGYRYVCSEFESYVRAQYTGSTLTQAVCLAHGVRASETARECGERVDQCINTMPPEAEELLKEILEEASCNRLDVSVSGCRATVAELERCLDALDVKLSQIQYGGVCAAVGSPIDEDWWKFTLPDACREIRNRCTG